MKEEPVDTRFLLREGHRAALLLAYLLFFLSHVLISRCFFFFAVPPGIWDLNSPTKLTVLALQVQSLNHGATRKDPIFYLLPEQVGKQAHQWENTQTASRS